MGGVSRAISPEVSSSAGQGGALGVYIVIYGRQAGLALTPTRGPTPVKDKRHRGFFSP